jgi:hypothetical protein
MPKICVEIEFDTDTGEVKVGQCPPEEEAAETPKDDSYLQPVQSVEAALAQAKQIIEGGGAQAGSPTADDQMAAGYQGVRGPTGLNGGQPQE